MFSAYGLRLRQRGALLALLSLATPAFADPNEIAELSWQAQQLIDAGKTTEAIPIAERAAQLTKTEFGDNSATYATSINRLGEMYRMVGRWSDAEPLYKRAREIRADQDKGKLTDTVNNLGILYVSQGRLAEAEPLLRQAIDDYTVKYGPEHAFVATSQTNLALVYRSMGRFTEAEELLKRALATRQKRFGSDHPDVANSLSSLAGLYREQGRYPEALGFVQQALAIRQKKLSPEHPDIASSLHVLAEIYRAQGIYLPAETALDQALAIRKKAFPAVHPSIATTLNSLGNVYEGEGRLTDAEGSYKAALVIQQKILAAKHPDLATTRTNLGALYKAQGRLDDAEPLLRAGLDVRKEVLDQRHPDYVASLILMGEFARERGRAEESRQYFDKALSLRRAAIREVPVYFATNRKRATTLGKVEFTGDRADALAFGYANVWVPEQAANPPRSAQAELSPSEETTAVQRLIIRSVTVMPQADVVQWARATLGRAHLHRKEALVFVHGFNVSFKNSLLRTAQIAYDLNFDGPVFLFTWPSRGGEGTLGSLMTLRYYPYDLESADLTVNYLVDFLAHVVAATEADKIHLIAHSMGNRPLLQALEKLKLMGSAAGTFKVGEVVMASPDVEVDRFKQLVAAVYDPRGGMTLYASTRDWALRASQWVWGAGPRAGYVSTDGPLITNGVDSIDVSAAGANPFELNHDVYVSSPAIFKDMRIMLQRGLRPPDQRTQDFILTPATTGGSYWVYRLPRPPAH